MRRMLPIALALVCAALALLLATSSSPLYATNFWTDTNIYFTIGRGMAQGLAPYRDLFDHKGPVLFMLYALGALISDGGFFGVYLLEVLSLAAALYLGWRLVCLHGEGTLTLLALPILAMATTCCAAFTQGGSAEEFALPALVLAQLAAFSRMRGEPARRWDLAFGAAAAWVFLIKFTNCGLFFGLGLCVGLHALRTGGVKAAFAMIGWMLAGFAAVVLPVAVYLLAIGALGSCIDVYFIQNLFDYGGEPMTLVEHVYNALAYLRTQSAANPAIALLAALGCAFGAMQAAHARRRGWIFAVLCPLMGAGLLLLFTYWGEMAHPYYALVFASLCPLGLAPLGWLSARVRAPRVERAAMIALCACILPACYALCQATPLLDVRKEDMAQTKFAQIIFADEDRTLLDITSLDQGFYLAAGIVPNCRYFSDNNLQTEEKRMAIRGYLEEGKTKYVVARWHDPGARYALIAEASSPFDVNDMRDYKLYRRIEE